MGSNLAYDLASDELGLNLEKSLSIDLPAPITWRDQNQAPASAIVEAHHLDAWLPQYEIDEEL